MATGFTDLARRIAGTAMRHPTSHGLAFDEHGDLIDWKSRHGDYWVNRTSSRERAYVCVGGAPIDRIESSVSSRRS